MDLQKIIPISITLEKVIKKTYLENKSFRDILEAYGAINPLDSSKESIPAVIAQSVILYLLCLVLKNEASLTDLLENLQSKNLLDSLTKEVYQKRLLSISIEFFDKNNFREDFQRFCKSRDSDELITELCEIFSPEDTKRTLKGVYYIPKYVTAFITRSVNQILKKELEFPDGLATINKKTGKLLVKILDPAAGTGNFLANSIDLITQALCSNGKEESINFSSASSSPNIYGFEIMLTSYAIANLRLTIKLHQSDYQFSGDEQFGMFLTDTFAEPLKESAPLTDSIFAFETKRADLVKTDKEITVIMCNPPYSSSVINKNVDKSIRTYKVPKGIKNSFILQDTYVQFLRLAHDYVERTEYGVIGMITNNAYLSSPAFAGMREEWLNFFSKIYILNLHGNRRTDEKSPSGENDENIFDIQAGLAIVFLIKTRKPTNKLAQLLYSDLWGLRTEKIEQLLTEDINKIDWIKLKPFEPAYYFNQISIPLHINLEGNGLHSLKKGIELYREFQTSFDYWLLKECVMFVNHGIELLMKEILFKQSEYLIFDDLGDTARKQLKATSENTSIFDIDNPPKTVTYDEAVRRVSAFVKNAELDKDFQTNLRALNHLRNKIEHHEVMLDGQTVGQLIETIRRPLSKLLNSQNIEANFLELQT